jgi:ketosteroid isomerase-like protein
MDREEVMRWVDSYERAWRSRDVDAVAELFGDDAHYRRSPYEPDDVGHAAIRDFWVDDEPVFSMKARPIAVEGDTAVVRVDVAYGDPVTREYRDLWVMRFGSDGRVDDFEEWAYWPGKPYSSEA